MSEFRPHVPADARLPELTWRSLVPGIAFGILFGAANAYLGLRAGLVVATSIPIAVITVAGYRFVRRGNLLEANMSQTIGSAASAVASGTIFTAPALFLWGFHPSLLQLTMLALAGGLLGTLFMIPLRPYLVEKEHGKLLFPEGIACAEVLIATEKGGVQSRDVAKGVGVGALLMILTTGLRLVRSDVAVTLPLLPKASLGARFSAALFGVGYIIGPRLGMAMMGGGLLSTLVIVPLIAWWGAGRATPLFPETELTIAAMTADQIWSRYVRYIGAGTVAVAGIVALARSSRTMLETFRVTMRNVGARKGTELVPRISRDLSFRAAGLAILAVLAVLTIVPQAFGGLEPWWRRAVAALLVAIFAFFFVTISARIVGLLGVTPASGMAIATLLGTSAVFLVFGWTDAAGKAGALAVGMIVAVAAAVSAELSQDLKTGYLLGATPRLMQIGQLFGVIITASCICVAVQLFGNVYGFGTAEMPAPQATMMKLVVDGVIDRTLPWTLVAIGAAIAILAALLRLPPLAFAVGVYLPFAVIVPIFLGGALRWWTDRDANAAARTRIGVLLGAGLVGGEGLAGLAIAGIAAYRRQVPRGFGPEWAGAAAPWITVGLFVALSAWFWLSLRAAAPSPGEETPRAS